MGMPEYELGPIRPVNEADSLLIRVTRGCPWNKCLFCTNYKGIQFSRRSVDEIKKDIVTAAEYYDNHPFESCFLQDGDSFILKTQHLIEILQFLKEHFPTLKRVTSYGRAQTIVRKSPQEMKEISNAGLTRLYCGMESGSDQVLKMVKKGVTSTDIIQAAWLAKDAGMEISEFIILGLGGKQLWKEHATKTAVTLNKINPHAILLLTIRVWQDSEMDRLLKEGQYHLQTESNIIEEQRLLVENLNGITSYYENHHISDLLIEAKGRLPEDKRKLLTILNRFLSLSFGDKINFVLGTRLGIYRRMDDMKNQHLKDMINRDVQKFEGMTTDQEAAFFHQLRLRLGR